MTGSLAALILATFAFVGAHIVLSSAPVRRFVIAKLGARPFSGTYSVLVAIPFVWMIAAYRGAPNIPIWIAPTGVKHITLTAIIVAAIFVVASISSNNPAAVSAPKPDLADGPKGIFRITRHPFMWGVAIWAITHLLATGDAASLVLFGGLAGLAILGTLHAESRKQRELGAVWDDYAAQSSHLPFLAVVQGRTPLLWSEIGWRPVAIGFGLYLFLLILHEPVIGTAPVSLVSGLFD